MIAVSLLFTLLLALCLDILLAEPKRFHPLVGFGYLAKLLEKSLNQPAFSSLMQQVLGACSWLTLVIIPTFFIVLLLAFIEEYAVFFLQSRFGWNVTVTWLLEALVLYIAIGYTSLKQHALAVLHALQHDTLTVAQEKVGLIVSRDTAQLDEVGVRRSAIESVLENGSDAIFAPIFWLLIGGIPAVIIYRLANTLDAMWGYKTPQLIHFGKFSARMDDILNLIPSRLVGISYALLGNTKQAINCWKEQADDLESPNGGVVMTAGAGALNLRLGGTTYYHGKAKEKPVFGGKLDPNSDDIFRAIRLIDRTLLLWCFCIGILGVINYLFANGLLVNDGIAIYGESRWLQ